jgi:hypothetical protein
MGFPSAETATVSVSCTGEDVLDVAGEIVRLMIATVPSGIGLVFNPKTAQVRVPLPALQDRDFPAPDAALPAEELIAENTAL